MRSLTIIFCVVLVAVSIPQVFAQPLRANPDSIPFTSAVNYNVGGDPGSVFCADLDGDGDLDLAVANRGSNTVSILKNNGDGTFQTKVDYAVGSYPAWVFCADLDGDGDLDLAVPNAYSDNLSILKNNGDGTFQTKVDYGTGDDPVSVFCADLDGDLDLDLAITNAQSNNVSIFKNNGDGTFQPALNYGTGAWPVIVFCADLDGDLDLDLAVANFYGNNVSILKNNGDGTFQTKVDYGAGAGSTTVFCADLDGDLDLDLAVTNAYSDNVSILKNNGDGTFQPKVDYAVGDSPEYEFCADLDGDGDLDLAVASAGSDKVSILRNNGDGTFQTKVDYSAGDSPVSVFCADLDGDGDMDLAVANNHSNNVSILLNLSISPPYSFSLLLPLDLDSILNPVNFDWEDAIDPSPNDTVRYTLLVTKSPTFNPDSTITYDSLLQSEYTESLQIGSYYWKVKAYDKWGAVRWSNETWSFRVHTGKVYDVDILDISDIDHDQGKQVRIKWTSFPGSDPLVTDFTIFRRIDPLLSTLLKGGQHGFPLKNYPPGEWDAVGTYQAFGETLYSAVVPTLKDSTIAEGMYWSIFFVRAGTANPIVYFDSPVDSGYSLDNLSPSSPTGLLASHAPAVTKLTWNTTPIPDFDYHTVYRDTTPGFTPSLSNRLGFTIDTTFVDSTAQLGRTCYYLVTSTDFSGNESDPSNEAMGLRYITGDANTDGEINIDDVVYLINYLFIGGPPPTPLVAGDANCDGMINVCDVVYLINYLFIGGPPPSC